MKSMIVAILTTLTVGTVSGVPAMAYPASGNPPKLVRLHEAGEPVYVFQANAYHWIPTHKIMVGLGYTYSEAIWRSRLPRAEGHPLTLFETANHEWYWFDAQDRAFYQVITLQPGVQYQKWTGQLRGTLPYLINGQARVESNGHIRITATYQTPQVPHPTISPWHNVAGSILTGVTVPIGWVHHTSTTAESWSAPNGTGDLMAGYVPKSAVAVAKALALPGTQIRAWSHGRGYFLIRHTSHWAYRTIILPGPETLVIQTRTLPGQGAMARVMLTSYHIGTSPNLLATSGLPPISRLP